MSPDPLDVLRRPDEPAVPRPEFAAELRHRLERELAPLDPNPPEPEEEVPMKTETTDPTTRPALRTTLIPYLAVADAAAAITFYKEAFGATEDERMTEPGGRIGHAEIAIGEIKIFLADEHPEFGVLSPTSLGGSPVSLMLQVPDVDATFDRAVALGATPERPVEDAFYGERSGWLIDPFGHRWGISTPIETVSREEMQRRVGGSYDVT